ncbi:hypothetical protein D3C76_1765270 [compost metagenome]
MSTVSSTEPTLSTLPTLEMLGIAGLELLESKTLDLLESGLYGAGFALNVESGAVIKLFNPF